MKGVGVAAEPLRCMRGCMVWVGGDAGKGRHVYNPDKKLVWQVCELSGRRSFWDIPLGLFGEERARYFDIGCSYYHANQLHKIHWDMHTTKDLICSGEEIYIHHETSTSLLPFPDEIAVQTRQKATETKRVQKLSLARFSLHSPHQNRPLGILTAESDARTSIQVLKDTRTTLHTHKYEVRCQKNGEIDKELLLLRRYISLYSALKRHLTVQFLKVVLRVLCVSFLPRFISNE